MSLIQHGVRIGLLMAGVAGLLAWSSYHSEVTFADGLRYIHQAEGLEQGSWSSGVRKAVDHPLHPLAIAAAHRVVGGSGAIAWQRAAQVAALAAAVLLVIPLYLVAREVYGDQAAWVCVLVFAANPILGYITINLLSETTFLLFWTWGLWAAVRFLREGRFFWLPLTIGFAALAYLARPEGLLLPLALVATLFVLPFHWATRIYWPRWWAAVAFLVLGPILLVAPYMALKGGIGTKPSVARLLGTAPKSAPTSMERDRPLPPNQSTFETYRIATQRMSKVVRTAVSPVLLPLVVLGLIVTRPWSARARIWLFTGTIVVVSALGLIRLHATGGYCTIRHGLIPAMLLVLAAGNGVAWVMRVAVIDLRWFGWGEERVRPGPAIWALALLLLLGSPYRRTLSPAQGSFAAYREAGAWIAETKAKDHGKVLDMTDWSLYFSGEPGFHFPDVSWALIDPNTRWVVVRPAHLMGHWNYSDALRQLIDGRKPVATFPANPIKGRLQIRIYDRLNPTREEPVQVATKARAARK